MTMKAKIITLVVVIAVVAVLRLSSVLLLIGMLPSFVVLLVDDHEERIWTKTVSAFNFSGLYPYLFDLYYFQQPDGTTAILKQMSDATMWLVIYGSAAFGYLAMWFCPHASEFVMRIVNSKRLHRHRMKMQFLNEEWGLTPYQPQEEDDFF